MSLPAIIICALLWIAVMILVVRWWGIIMARNEDEDDKPEGDQKP